MAPVNIGEYSVHAETLCPDPCAESIYGDDRPGVRYVDTHDSRNPVQPEDPSDQNPHNGVNPEEGGHADENAEGEGQGQPVWGVLDAEE